MAKIHPYTPRVVPPNIELPPFWNDAPVAWFVAAEAQFELRHVDSQKECFCHKTTALDKLSLKKIVHLLANPDPILPYTKLKEALLASHILTDFQRVELLLAVEPLGGRKPSKLLADMWELCPDNQHNSIFFAVLFLQRLTREIRVMLSHEDQSDLHRLAAHRLAAPPDNLRWPPGDCHLRHGATPGQCCGRHPTEGQAAVQEP